MSFPFGNYDGRFLTDEIADPNAVYLFNPKYKNIPVGDGEPLGYKTVIDWDVTAKTSAAIVNIGEGKK